MGKYRILLVLTSMFMMILDIFVNKANNSYLTTACVFFAMLLYDHEKIIRTTKNKVQKITAQWSAGIYTVILTIHLILFIASYPKAAYFITTNKGLLGLDVKVFEKITIHTDWFLGIITFLVVCITFTEVLCEKDDTPEKPEEKKKSEKFNPVPNSNQT